MSELKEAITYFEQLLRRFEDAPDETYWGKEHNATTRKMIGIAIDALRRAQPENSRQHALQTGVCPMCEDCPDGCPVEAPNDSRNRPENEPLTLDELRQMDGEPVFAVDGEGHSAWVVVNAKGECCADNEFGSWAFSYYEMMMPTVLTESENKLHPMGWLAYRYKPERSEG